MKIKITESQINKLIDEALGDDLPPYMRDIIQKRYKNAEKYLSMDVPTHTDKIPNVKVEVEDQNITNKTISELVQYFSENILKQFSQSEMFKMINKNSYLSKIITDSIGFNPVDTSGDTSKQIKRLSFLYSKDFRLPVGKDNQISNPTFSNNKSSIGNFLKISSKVFPELNNLNVESMINDKHFVGLRDPIINYQMNLKKVTDATLYLYITDKPNDKLRMSISHFYDSCQNLYTGGDLGTQYNKKLLSNVFDENSKVAYLMFDSPFRDKNGNMHPYSSIARTIIRVNNEGGIMFDRVYPGDMEEIFYSIIEDKTGLKNVGKPDDFYHYKGIGLPSPYMDRYRLKNVGEKNNEETGRIAALMDVTDFDPKDLKVVNEILFEFDGETWSVLTYDEAIEKTRDYFRDSWYDIFFENKFREVIDYGFLPKQPIIDILDIDEDEMESEGWELDEYLENVYGIETLSDFNKILKNQTSRSWAWFIDNLDIDSIFRHFGGEYESMVYALGYYDNTIHESGKYYVYRIQ
jgi:hypothetical protein